MNKLQQLKSLIGIEATRLATVNSNNGDGTSTVTLYGGGTFRVSGETAGPGTKVFVRDGRIDAEAPNLTPTDITV